MTVIAATTLAAVGVSGVASAVSLWQFVGKVTDPLGNPIAGAVVSDGGQQTTTAADGSYALGENGTGNYDLTAIAVHHAQEGEQATVLAPATTTVNFTLPYVLGGQLDHPALQSGSPTSATLTVTDWAPAGGSCVEVTDSRTGASSAAALAAENADGSSTWTWVLALPQGAAEGNYLLSMLATRCSDGAALTTTASTPYVVDNTPPSITGAFPAGWYGHSSAQVGATVKDALSGIDVAQSTIAVDGQALAQPYSYSSSGLLSGSATGLSDGPHQVSITAVDGAGNTAVLSYGFSVDTTPPAYSGEAPTGQVSSTPRISIDVADDSSISAGSITMTLSMGPVSCRVQPTYSPATGAISYQVPSSATGPCLGEAPLPPGTYEVAVSSSDAAGNVGSVTWSFVVDPPLLLP
ncbi:MAG: carboxypeptidase regulatory-like domain-containing protein [Acidimicrobiales bacterium]